MGGVVLGLGYTISSIDVAAIDANSEALGVPRLLLMENAGRSVAAEVEARARPGARIAVYAGPGGNGGDGLAAARLLATRGYRVVVYLVAPCGVKNREAAIMLNALKAMDTSVELVEARGAPGPVEANVVVDALLGVGLRGAPRSPFAEAIEAVNASSGVKIAVDIPSGLDADTGEAPGPVVRADVTVTLHKPKPGLLRRRDIAGEIVVATIGAPPEAETYVGPGDVRFRVPQRRWDTRKGHGGRVLVIGGSTAYPGAPVLAALAAERSGVDLVYLASPQPHPPRPTVIPVKLGGEFLKPSHVEKLIPLLERVNAVALGPGLGTQPETMEAAARLVEEARKRGKPVVLDADGLKTAAEKTGMLGPGVLATPHDAEFERVFGQRPPGVDCIGARVEEAAKAARSHPGLVVLLKGPVDVITDGSRARLNKTGAPAMSVGGTGDTLAGIAAAMLAKRLPSFDAAAIAAYVNGAAGALAYRRLGDAMTALDLVEEIPRVLSSPEETAEDAMIYKRLPLRRGCKRLEGLDEGPSWPPVGLL